MFTKQHYKVIAEVITNPHADASDYHDGCMGNDRLIFTDKLIDDFIVRFEQDNPGFDKDEFSKACGFKE